MTLHLTAVSPNGVLQVSDRRLVRLPGMQVADEHANKAILLVCADATVAIAFAGVAEMSGKRTDSWLARELLESCAPELPVCRVLNMIRDRANENFASLSWMRDDWSISIVFAGFERPSRVPFFSSVTASAARARRERQLDFSVTATRGESRLFVSGYHRAISEADVERLQAIGRAARNREQIERGFVSAIRRKAGDPRFSSVIGRNCLAVGLDPDGRGRITDYPESGTARSQGPYVVWYEAGYNFLVEAPATLLGTGYGVVFGELPSAPMLVCTGPRVRLPRGAARPVQMEPALAPPVPAERASSLNAGQVKFTVASRPQQYHPQDSAHAINLVSVVRTKARPRRIIR